MCPPNLPVNQQRIISSTGNATDGRAWQPVPEILRIRVGTQSRAAGGTPRLTQNLGQATDVQLANAQCDEETPCALLSWARLDAAVSAVGREPMDAAGWQLVPIDMVTPRGEMPVNTGSPSLEAVVTWSVEQLLWMATSLPAMRTIRHQPWGLDAKDVYHSQEAASTSHALPQPVEQAGF